MHFLYIATISLGLAGTSLALPRKNNGTTYHSCRALPGDAAWPSVRTWQAFNATINGRLIATTPLAQPCHGDFYDAETCENLKSQWDFPWIHSQDPSSIDQPWFQNGTCDPFHPVNQTCTLGNLVSYSVNLSSAADVQASLKFAEKKNLRIVIKNTGHDFIGKSTGKGGLGLWTHFLNSTEVIQNYTSPPYSGPAIKLGAGVQAYQAYEAAHEAGYRVTGGTCPTVGLAGGYTQGGGHGALSSLYGLGADNVLEWEVVTPRGEHIVTSPQNHSDLHWALSGGGGGTFGVVISMTAKLHKDGPTSGGSLTFNTSSAGISAFWDVIEEFQGGLEPLVDSGAVALYQITNTNFLSIFTAPGLSESQLKQKLEFFTTSLNQHNITYTFTTSDDSTYFDHFVRYYGPLPAGIWETSHLVSSRLFPRSVIRENNSGVIAAYRNITSDPNWIAAGLAMNASHATAGNKPGDNAVLPAWRDALIHTLFYSPWDWEASQSTIQSREDHLTYNIAPSVEALTLGSGTYLNEANFNQLNWQETFYGENYDKLLAIKHKYDPHGLLYARTAVGSEAWAEDGNARLCRTGD